MALLLGCCACGGEQKLYDASGIFETTEVIVSSKGTGEILQFAVEEGMQVQPGLPLGTIDTVQLILQRRQLEAELRAVDSGRLDAGSQLESLRRQIVHAQREKARFEALAAAQAVPRKQLEDIDSQLKVLESQLDAAAEQLRKSNAGVANRGAAILAQLALVDEQLRNCRIVSPVGGTILAKYAERGEYTTQGRPLFKVGDTERMKLRAYLTGDQLSSVALGQKVTVYADDGKTARKAYEGVVSWISDRAEFTPKTIQTRNERAELVYAVRIAVRNDGGIKRGMYGDVKF